MGIHVRQREPDREEEAGGEEGYGEGA